MQRVFFYSSIGEMIFSVRLNYGKKQILVSITVPVTCKVVKQGSGFIPKNNLYTSVR
jgi:hypothetical protein